MTAVRALLSIFPGRTKHSAKTRDIRHARQSLARFHKLLPLFRVEFDVLANQSIDRLRYLLDAGQGNIHHRRFGAQFLGQTQLIPEDDEAATVAGNLPCPIFQFPDDR